MSNLYCVHINDECKKPSLACGNFIKGECMTCEYRIIENTKQENEV